MFVFIKYVCSFLIPLSEILAALSPPLASFASLTPPQTPPSGGAYRMRSGFQPENHPPWRGLYPKASLFIFACGRNFSPKIIRLGGDFIRRLPCLFSPAVGISARKPSALAGTLSEGFLVYFRLRPEFQSENHPPWRGLYPKAPCLFSPAAGFSTGKRTDKPK